MLLSRLIAASTLLRQQTQHTKHYSYIVVMTGAFHSGIFSDSSQKAKRFSVDASLSSQQSDGVDTDLSCAVLFSRV